MLPQINIDLDGVLVDFERGFEMFYGQHPKKVSEPEMWKIIEANVDHWHDLPAMPGALQLWAYVAQYNARVITGCPKTGYKTAEAGKRAWIAREMGQHVPVVTCLSRDKPQFMANPGDILIDDMTKNIRRWEEAGGVGIHHTEAKLTIAKLQELGF
jgi:hypothetical protein